MPGLSSVFSALGCLTARPAYQRQQTLRLPSCDWDGRRLEEEAAALAESLAKPLLESGHGSADLSRETVALVRYADQSYAVEIPIGGCGPETIGRDFRAAHTALYGFATDEDWEVESVRVTVSALVPFAMAALHGSDDADADQRSAGPCLLADHGWCETPRHAETRSQDRGPCHCRGHVVDGGAAAWLEANDAGNLLIEVGP